MDLIQLKDIAIKAAISAGQLIESYMHKDIAVEEKKGGTSLASQVLTEVDKECETVILSHLLPTCKAYDLALLTEESQDNGSRFQKDYFWCIDPMDGTLPFINKQAGFSVSIALVAKNGTPLIGVVYDPCEKNLYYAIKGYGAYKNDQAWKVDRSNTYLTYVTDRKLKDTPRSKDLEDILIKKAQELQLNGFKEMAGGGAVMNAIWVLENGPACMLKFPKKENGGGSIWDYAATACIFHELGLPATTYNGNPLALNRKESTFMNHQGVFFANFNISN